MPDFDRIEVEKLVFDEQNPRLPSRLKGASQEEILRYLATKTNIGNLVASISTNGFFSGEAIVVMPERDKYVVLEGNRRLTAVKLLDDADLTRSISGALAQLVESATSKPLFLPCYVVERRQDALQYLGFRHISGVQRWTPLAKARYLQMLYEEAEGDPESRYTRVAEEIGSRRTAVRRSLDALAAYERIEEEQFFDIDSVNEDNFQFGTFYTAIADHNIANYVGARNDDDPTHLVEHPEYLKEPELRSLTEWMFQKDSEGKTRLGESRNISQLSAVVASTIALKRFRDEGATLEVAYLATPDVASEFIKSIQQAQKFVQQARQLVDSVDHDDKDVLSCVQKLEEEIRDIKTSIGLSTNA